MRKIILFLSILVLVNLNVTSAVADGASRDDPMSGLAPFQKLIEAGQYQQAIDKLGLALKEAPDDADLLNLIAYSHRNFNQYDDALRYYLKALEIDPEHLGANEYLGELYLKLGQLDNARERLTVLDGACFFGCEEFYELKQEIEEYEAENPS